MGFMGTGKLPTNKNIVTLVVLLQRDQLIYMDIFIDNHSSYNIVFFVSIIFFIFGNNNYTPSLLPEHPL